MTQSVSLYLICIVIFATTTVLALYLTQAHYSRKETVKGYLIPQSGVIKVLSSRAGVIENLYVKEGDRVLQDELLAQIRNSQSLTSGVELSAALAKELTLQIETLNLEYQSVEDLYKKDLNAIDSQLDQLHRSLGVIRKIEKTRDEKLSLKKRQLVKNQRLHKQGHLSSSLLDQIKADYLAELESGLCF